MANKPYIKKYHEVDGKQHISNPITLHNSYPGLNVGMSRRNRRHRDTVYMNLTDEKGNVLLTLRTKGNNRAGASLRWSQNVEANSKKNQKARTIYHFRNN